MANSSAGTPRREDLGDLIVLHLYGSYRDMGRQHVELLGPLAREVYALQLTEWKRLVAEIGFRARLLDSVMPSFWIGVWRPCEESGTFQAVRGLADRLNVSGADAWRGAFGFLGGPRGSTAFAATRTATEGGTAVIGRNADVPDGYGRRRPLVTHYHPTGNDLSYVGVGWPLLPGPQTGINEAGLSIAINAFNADQILGLLPQTPVPRALQTARTVEEAVEVFTTMRSRGGAAFATMADADGDIALVEYTPSQCSVFRPAEDWFAQANHARTEQMISHERGRHPGSFTRQVAMENAVRRHLGEITPEIASRIIRDRTSSPFVNCWKVASNSALNSVVMCPASKTLWHSTTMQPQAPFGELVPFSVAEDTSTIPSLPADPRLGTPEMAREAEVIAKLRRAIRLFDDGHIEEAGSILDGFANDGEPLLDPYRLSWARARVRWSLIRLHDADSLLGELDVDAAPFDVRANGLLARALVTDRIGHRSDALQLYEKARGYMDTHPEFTDPFLVDPLRRWIAAGFAAPQVDGAMPYFPDLLQVPR